MSTVQQLSSNYHYKSHLWLVLCPLCPRTIPEPCQLSETPHTLSTNTLSLNVSGASKPEPVEWPTAFSHKLLGCWTLSTLILLHFLLSLVLTLGFIYLFAHIYNILFIAGTDVSGMHMWVSGVLYCVESLSNTVSFCLHCTVMQTANKVSWFLIDSWFECDSCLTFEPCLSTGGGWDEHNP